MGMQYDVKSAYRANDGALVQTRTRLKGVFISVSSAGSAAVLYDNANAASGNILMTIPAAAVGQHTIVIPGEGILAENGIFVDINGLAGITIFYG
jgi:hypothetical protein